MREKGQNEVAKTLETPVFSRGREILTEKWQFEYQRRNARRKFPDSNDDQWNRQQSGRKRKCILRPEQKQRIYIV